MIGRISLAAVLSAAATLAVAGPAFSQEKAHSADSFVESLGINNLDLVGTTIDSNGHILDPIYDLGFRYARTVLNATGNPNSAEAGLFNNYGVRFDYLWPAGYTAEKLAGEVQALPAGSVISVEGNNECDNEGVFGGIGIPAAVSLQASIFQTFKADPRLKNIQVLAFTVIHDNSYTSPSNTPAGNSSQAYDAENYHPYPGNELPGLAIWKGIYNAHKIERAATTYKPIVVTETGANLSPASQAKTIPIIYADNYLFGVERTYVYALAKGQFGFTIAGQPAGAAMGSLISLLGEAVWQPATHAWKYPKFDTGYLSGSLDTHGVASVRHILLQRSNGDFYLLVWDELAVYNSTTKTDIDNPPAPVVLHLGTDIASATCLTQDRTTGAYGATPLSLTGPAGNQTVSLNIPDSVMVVHLVPAKGLIGTQKPVSVYSEQITADAAKSGMPSLVPDETYLVREHLVSGVKEFCTTPGPGGQIAPVLASDTPGAIEIDALPIEVPAHFPITIPVENFDPVANVGYGTSNTENYNVPLYRPGPFVITQYDPNANNGVCVGYFNSGDWLRYTIDVAAAGSYSIGIRYCGFGGKCHYEFGALGGKASLVTPTIDLPKTSGDWTNYQTVATPVHLSAGRQWMKLYCDYNGYNVDSLTISPSD